MRILFLSRWYPYPADNGSKLRVSALLRALCAAHEVTLLSFYDPAEPREVPPASVPCPASIHLCPYREFRPRSARAIAGFLRATPRYLIDTRSPEMQGLISMAVRGGGFEVVIASQLPMAAYNRSFRGIPAIFEEVELGTYRGADTTDAAATQRFRRAVTWQKHRRFIAGLLKYFGAATVVSEVERRLVSEAAPSFDRVHVIPNCLEADHVDVGHSVRSPASLIFTGSLRYAPNWDGMNWFVRDVFPIIRDQVPRAELAVTGEPGGRRLDSVGVRLIGRVPDIRGALRQATVSIAPIRAGGGTRLKILEAMATRTPLVVTSKAIEGLDIRHGEHVLLADSVPEFADAVVRILREPVTASEMADRAWKLFSTRYDSAVVLPPFLRLVEEIGGLEKPVAREGSAA